MKTCSEEELLSRYLDGELDGSARLRLEKHLAGCPACREALARLGAPAAVLRTFRPPAGRADRAWKCPDDEKIASWLEDRLAPESRKGIAAHLAGCPACANRAGQIAQDLEAIAAVREAGLKTVPPKLEMMTAAALVRRSPLGRVAVDLKKILDFPGWWRDLAGPELRQPELFFNSAAPAQRAGAFNEPDSSRDYMWNPEADFLAERSGNFEDRWDFQKRGIRVEVGFGKSGRGPAACLVRVRDRDGNPAAGVAVSLDGGPKPLFASTDRSGRASLGPVVPGEYRLRVDFGTGAEVRIEAR